MKTSTLFGSCASALVLGLGGCATAPTDAPAPAEETLAELSRAADVVLENDYVHVTRISLAPGESLPSHVGEARVVYALSDYEIAWREPGESEARRAWRQGDVHFHEAGAHGLTNVGTTTADFVIFERRAAALPEDDAAVADAAEASPETATLLFENDIFRVLRVALAPGAAQPVHGGRPRVVYSLSDYELAWSEEGHDEAARSWRAGEAHWHLAGDHAARNVGETNASWLIVSLKD